ncbi:hypothetical protein SCHPADRAFT_921997 [Schizopora paradoxa]|uniref:Mitochondrial import receptor subunit tom40 n=1 Tax=Schizopora paradoxa TaxID=27342 RepID=A0A0H2S0W1_9AGAM|nr:hypothetical protein SCHPADRAFT_921997 [Schizopora paradoxa]
MASSSFKDGLESISPSRPSSSSTSFLPSFLSPISEGYDVFSRWRTSLGLPNPGTSENLQKEAKSTHLTNHMFDGARADLTKILSVTPAFQVTHSFSLASQTALPSYNFGAIYANSKIFMQGGVDHEGTVNGRFNSGWDDRNISKIQVQLSSSPAMGHMIQMEHDYLGQDYSINVKALNPYPVNMSGIVIGNYLQSVTKNLALGAEVLFSKNGPPGAPPFSSSYLAKYTGSAKNWIATAHLQPQGVLTATYWQKINEKVDAAADFTVINSPAKREGTATLGVKYDLRMATFRAQLDSSGKVSALLEQRFAPSFQFLVSGEIDHFKNSAKVGVGVMIDSSSLSPEELGMVPPPTESQPPPPYP